MAYLKFFPEELMQLQVEVQYYPDLMKLLLNHMDRDPELQFAKMLAEIAAYVGVVMDDTYSPEQLTAIAGECVDRLRKKRSPIITLN